MNTSASIRARLLLPLALAALPVFAADYWVAVGGTGDYRSAATPGPSPVDGAKLATAAGDVVHVGPGTYTVETGVSVANGAILIGGSDDPEATRIVRHVTGNNDRVVMLGVNAQLRNVTVAGGYTDYQAAGVLGFNGAVHKNFSVSNCVVENCSALYKGGASMGGVWRNCVIRNCTVRNPRSSAVPQEGSGGGIWGGTLYDCVLTNNTANYAGGALAGSTGDPCVAYNCTLAGNTAPYGSGAGTDSGPNACRLYNCNVVSNDGHNATGQAWGGKGGGVYNCFVTNSLIAWNKTRIDNRTTGEGGSAGLGGGAGVYRGRVYDSTIMGNYTTAYGGAYTVDGGGAEAAYLENCRILDNVSVRYGGGTLDCTNVNCVIAGNRGTGGGGLFRGLAVNCVISNNTASSIQGGAAYNAETRNCLVVGNHTYTHGTLCRGYHQGDIVVGNVAERPGAYATGICAADGNRDCVAVNCTVYGNVTGTAGGTAAAGVSNCAITNTLVAGHATDVKNLVSASHSLARTGAVPAGAEAMLGDVDPRFEGSPSQTAGAFALRLSSPCRDRGVLLDWMAGATDILGNPRVKWGAPDIGACECVAQLASQILVR